MFVCFGFFLQTWIYLVGAEFWTASSQVTVREVNTIISHLKSSWGICLINISLKKHFMIHNTKDLSQELCNLFLQSRLMEMVTDVSKHLSDALKTKGTISWNSKEIHFTTNKPDTLCNILDRGITDSNKIINNAFNNLYAYSPHKT